MSDVEASRRTEVATQLFTDRVLQQVKAPVRAADIRVGEPRRIHGFAAAPGNSSFWRIPLFSLARHRLIGFFDVREIAENANILRVSRVPRRDLVSEEAVEALPVDILEMGDESIIEEVRKAFGEEVTITGKPELVFEQVESRITWKVVGSIGKKSLTILVTPGFAHEFQAVIE